METTVIPSKIKILVCENGMCVHNICKRCNREEITIMPEGECLNANYTSPRPRQPQKAVIDLDKIRHT